MAFRPAPRTLLAAIAFVPCVLLLLPLFAVTVSMALVARCARLIGRLLEPRFVPWTELIAFDGELGWRPKPALDVHYLAARDDVFRVVTDAEGWPGRQSLDESRVVVIGDSFAFGYGVDTNESFANRDAGLRVKAVGAPGYSMVHGVLLMEQLATRLRGKLVVWLVFLENDLQDNLVPEMRQYRAPFVRRDRANGTWAIAHTHVRPAAWSCSDLDKQRLFPRLCTPGPLADRAYSACDFLIGRAAATCAPVGAQLAIVTVPDVKQLTPLGVAQLATASGSAASFDADLPDRRIAECCHRHEVPMVRGKTFLSAADYKRREGIHWNRQGHQRMTRLLRTMEASFTAGTMRHLVPHDAGATSECSDLLIRRLPAHSGAVAVHPFLESNR